MEKVILLSGKATTGKDATAKILKRLMEQDNKKVLIAHYADLLKYICKTFFGWNGEKDEEGRRLLQRIGTDVIRDKEPNFWVSFIAQVLLMFKNEWDITIIPDTRFPNEIEFMRLIFDTFTVRVNRLNYQSPLTEEQQNHPSETALDGYQFDYYIDSESGLDKLEKEVKKMYEYMKLKDGDFNKV